MWPGITGVIIGLLIGGTAVAIWLKRRGGSAESVAVLKRENAQFREEVNEHFVQTAELINQLTDSYKAVFDHLSEGAEKLVDPEVVRERMPQVGNEEVRLKRIGAPRPSDQHEDKTPPASVESHEPESNEQSDSESLSSDSSAAESEPDENTPHRELSSGEATEKTEQADQREESDEVAEEKGPESAEQEPDDDEDKRRRQA